MTIYDDKNKCLKCKGQNDLNCISSDGGHISECETKCQSCGYEDYWMYGYYASKSEPPSEEN